MNRLEKEYEKREREERLAKTTGGKTQKRLLQKASEYFHNKEYDLTIQYCLEALEAAGDNPIDRHFVYNYLIKTLYKMRDKKEGTLEKCIKYCLEDIERIPIFLKEYQKQNTGFPPECPSVTQLVIIYEKNGEIEDAIDLCNKAIDWDLQKRYDYKSQQTGKPEGFRARLERLQKKL